MAKITVIVPVYNVEKYLSRCVDSLLHQSFADFDLILVDDGSADKSGEICDAYAEQNPRITVIHQENGGQAAAKNRGIAYAYAHSDSQWLTFIDSDDWVDTSYLQTLMLAAETCGAEIAVCDLAVTEGDIPARSASATEPVCLRPEELWVKNRLAATIPVCKLFSKSVFEGFAFPEKKVHEDELLIYKILFSREKTAYIDAQLYYYYQNPDGITLQKKWTPDRADSVTAFSEQCRFFRKNGYPKAEAVSAEALFVGCAEVVHNLLTLYPEEKKLIRRYRAVLCRTWRTYRASLDFSMIGSKKSYMLLAHPLLMALRKKGKHAMIFFRRLIHA